MLNKYKNEIIIALFTVIFVIAFYYLYGLLLPFIIGLILAFAGLPVVTKIQKVLKNRNLATTFFLIGILGVLILFFLFLSQYINKDFKRLNHSFQVLASENQEKLDNTGKKIKEYIGKIYDFDDLESGWKVQVDSLSTRLRENGVLELDTETIGTTFEKIASVFENDSKPDTNKKSGFSFGFILLSSIFYFVLILYNIEYFVSLRTRYFKGKIESKFQQMIDDFNKSFVKYFKLRTRIVLILSLLYIPAFIILNMPGMILFTMLIILLSYIPYFQYIVLIPISISCLVLSIESDYSFLFYFGIIAGVFIIASILEELILNPRIMEKNIGLNPVIMVLAISVWGYILGIPGLLIGIPLTSLIIIYSKKYFLATVKHEN